MIEHTINPVIVGIGNLEIRYYGLFYLLGLVFGYFMVNWLKKEFKINLTRDQVFDYTVYLAFGLFIGARLFYFIFYNPWVFWQSPLDILKLWHGGMSFHGGLVGALVAGFIFCKKNNVPFYKMADLTIIPTALVLALGRIGNFINGELYGIAWDGLICIDYSNNPHLANPPEGCRFPSQIAESLKNLVIFGTLFLIRGCRLASGSILWIFVFMYGFFRFFIEFVRVPDPQLGLFFGFLSMGQILSLLMIILGSVMFIRINVFKKL